MGNSQCMDPKEYKHAEFAKKNAALDGELIIASKDSVPGSFQIPLAVNEYHSPLILRRIRDITEFEDALASTSDIPLASLFHSRKSWAEEAIERRSQLRSEDDPSVDRETTGFIRDVQGSLETDPAEGEIYLLTDGQVYQGQWLRGKMHGHGTLYSNAGVKYEGTFVAGKKEGHGTMTLEDGRVYVGPFENDVMQGSGRFVGSFGEEYRCKATTGSIEIESLETGACL